MSLAPDGPHRAEFLAAAVEFVRAAVKIPGVRGIGVLGSIVTARSDPKDIGSPDCHRRGRGSRGTGSACASPARTGTTEQSWCGHLPGRRVWPLSRADVPLEGLPTRHSCLVRCATLRPAFALARRPRPHSAGAACADRTTGHALAGGDSAADVAGRRREHDHGTQHAV
jgi:hypothetical protein